VHLICMTKDIKTSQLDHTEQILIIKVDNVIEITFKMRIYQLTEYIGRGIDIHDFALRRIEHVHRTNPIIERQFLKTRDSGMALFIQIVYFESDGKLYFIGIFLLQTRKFGKVIIHPVPLHRPCCRKWQRSVRRNAIRRKAFTNGKTDKIFHISSSVTI